MEIIDEQMAKIERLIAEDLIITWTLSVSGGLRDRNRKNPTVNFFQKSLAINLGY